MKEKVLLRIFVAMENAYYYHYEYEDGNDYPWYKVWSHELLYHIMDRYEKYLIANHFDLVVEHIPWIDPIAWKISRNQEEERLASSLQS